VHRHGSSFSLTAAGCDIGFLAVDGACVGFKSCRFLHGVFSSRINRYRIPVGHPIAVSPPRVHAEIMESRSQVQGPQIALTGKALSLYVLYFLLKNISFEIPTFWLTVQVFQSCGNNGGERRQQ